MTDEPQPADYSASVLVEQSTPYTAKPKRAPLPHAFTSQNAREMCLKGWEARRRRESQPIGDESANQPPSSNDEYAAKQLVRVRALLDDVDAQLAKAKDPQDRERLARASHVLAERERTLSGRPLPGAFRPSKTRSTAAPSADVV